MEPSKHVSVAMLIRSMSSKPIPVVSDSILMDLARMLILYVTLLILLLELATLAGKTRGLQSEVAAQMLHPLLKT